VPEGRSRKIAGSLVTASSAAVLAVYIAGYARTQSAVRRFDQEVAERRVAGISRQKVASVRDGLAARSVMLPEGVLPEPEHAATTGGPWKDGVYTGWGFSPHGNIEAAVTITGGRMLWFRQDAFGKDNRPGSQAVAHRCDLLPGHSCHTPLRNLLVESADRGLGTGIAGNIHREHGRAARGHQAAGNLSRSPLGHA